MELAQGYLGLTQVVVNATTVTEQQVVIGIRRTEEVDFIVAVSRRYLQFIEAKQRIDCIVAVVTRCS